MRILILFLSFLICFNISAEARLCEEPNACGNTILPKFILKKFASYTAFDSWLVANPYTNFEIIYSTSSIVTILIYIDMVYTEDCWDKSGVCTLQ